MIIGFYSFCQGHPDKDDEHANSRQENKNSIKFEKLIFHTSACYGWCPKVDIEIDNKRNIYLYGEFYKEYTHSEFDSTGQYIGVLKKNLYHKLIRLIRASNIEQLPKEDTKYVDAPISTLIMYYNSQRIYLKYAFPPIIARELFLFLSNLYKEVPMTKPIEQRTLEY